MSGATELLRLYENILPLAIVADALILLAVVQWRRRKR